MNDKPTLIMGDLDYVAKGGNHCPVCGSDQIEGGSLDIEVVLTQEVQCLACGACWIDIYKLVGFADLEDDAGNSIDRGPMPHCASDEDLQAMFKAAAAGYDDSDNGNAVERVLSGSLDEDKLAECVVHEIRDAAIVAGDKNLVGKAYEAANAIGAAISELRQVKTKLEQLAAEARRTD